MSSLAIICWALAFGFSWNRAIAAAIANDTALVSSTSFNLTDLEIFPLQTSGLHGIDHDFSIGGQYGVNIPITPLSVFMVSVESLAILSVREFNGIQSPFTWTFPGYEDLAITVSGGSVGTQVPILRKYAIWGIQQGIYQIGRRGLQDIYTAAVFHLRYLNDPIGTVVFAPPAQLNNMINATAGPPQFTRVGPGLESRADIGRSVIDERAALDTPTSMPQEPDEPFFQSLDPSNTWEGHLQTSFLFTGLTMPAYFNAFTFGLSQVAESNYETPVQGFEIPIDALQVGICVDVYGRAPRSRPPIFTYEWAGYGLTQSAREGAKRVQAGLPLVQMEGIVGLSRPGSRTRIKVGKVQAISMQN